MSNQIADDASVVVQMTPAEAASGNANGSLAQRILDHIQPTLQTQSEVARARHEAGQAAADRISKSIGGRSRNKEGVTPVAYAALIADERIKANGQTAFTGVGSSLPARAGMGSIQICSEEYLSPVPVVRSK